MLKSWIKWLSVLLAAWLLSFSVFAKDAVLAGNVDFAALPDEAKVTLRLIQQGGPFPYAKDGVVFGNYERALPKQYRGYYREYTVKTPGVKHRGARRIISGGNSRYATEYYYTSDHYQTFYRIRDRKQDQEKK